MIQKCWDRSSLGTHTSVVYPTPSLTYLAAISSTLLVPSAKLAGPSVDSKARVTNFSEPSLLSQECEHLVEPAQFMLSRHMIHQSAKMSKEKKNTASWNKTFKSYMHI